MELEKQKENSLKQINEYRNKVLDLEQELLDSGVCYTGDELDKINPLKHSFGDGCYIREIFMPAGQVIISKIHKKLHPYFIMRGKVSILTDEGVQHIQAPYSGITKPGTKRVLYMHEDTVFITVSVTDKTDLKEIEDEVIAKDFQDPLITKADLELLKNEK
jgi:hypothetical protein|tara:strand:- start:605 stop:1087 length:483 start_codon:yes stop_codon:yes gene_type:complete